jgi:cell shape-determining protein MreD
MNKLNTIAVLVVAFVAVYLEVAWSLPRRALGCQVDLLPALIVYVALFNDVTVLALLAALGGLWFDSLSANPLGVTVLPLFAVGFAIFKCRDLILRELRYAQFLIGLGASALVPLLTLLLLLNAGQQPLIAWSSLWDWLVMALAGGAMTPLFVRFFAWLQTTFKYQRAVETSFRPDREIKRGRQ